MLSALAYFSFFSTAFPLCLGVFRWKVLSHTLKLITIYTATSFAFDALGLAFVYIVQRNIIIMNVYDIVHFVVLGMYFRSMAPKLLRKPVWDVYYFGGILLLFLTIFIFNDPFELSTFQLTNGFIYISIILFVIGGFVSMLRDIEHDSLLNNPHFFISVGILFHLTSASLLFFTDDYLNENESLLLWAIFKGLMQIFMNGMIAYGLYLGQKNRYAI